MNCLLYPCCVQILWRSTFTALMRPKDSLEPNEKPNVLMSRTVVVSVGLLPCLLSSIAWRFVNRPYAFIYARLVWYAKVKDHADEQDVDGHCTSSVGFTHHVNFQQLPTQMSIDSITQITTSGRCPGVFQESDSSLCNTLFNRSSHQMSGMYKLLPA